MAAPTESSAALVDDREPVLHPLLRVLFGRLDAGGVQWCLLRGMGELADPDGDVDLLVRPADLPRLRRAAADVGFANMPAWGYGSHRFFIAYEAEDDRWVKLDVVTELAFGPDFALRAGAELERDVLARRGHAGVVAVLMDDDAFWALLLHVLMDKGTVTAAEQAQLRALSGCEPLRSPLAALAARCCPRGWTADRMVASARGGDWAGLLEASPDFIVTWRRRDALASRARTLTTRFWRLAGKPLRASRRRGLSVAFLAPDGAGKTTLADGLCRAFYRPVRVRYMAPYPTRPAGRPASALASLGLSGRLLLLWGRWMEARYQQTRGRLVIFDRYPYDALLPGRTRLSRRGAARRWLLGHGLPPPDLTVVLDVPATALHARKSEQAVATLARERLAYLRLARTLRRAVVVDATGPAEQVRRTVTALIWQGQARRWNSRWGVRPFAVAEHPAVNDEQGA